jgi:hypothetical protein
MAADSVLLQILSSRDAEIFLAELTNRVTIMARGAYPDVDDDVRKLKAANETLHSISGKLVAAARGTPYCDEAFLRVIREKAGDAFSRVGACGCGKDRDQQDIRIARVISAIRLTAWLLA